MSSQIMRRSDDFGDAATSQAGDGDRISRLLIQIKNKYLVKAPQIS